MSYNPALSLAPWIPRESEPITFFCHIQESAYLRDGLNATGAKITKKCPSVQKLDFFPTSKKKKVQGNKSPVDSGVSSRDLVQPRFIPDRIYSRVIITHSSVQLLHPLAPTSHCVTHLLLYLNICLS